LIFIAIFYFEPADVIHLQTEEQKPTVNNFKPIGKIGIKNFSFSRNGTSYEFACSLKPKIRFQVNEV